MNEAICSYYTNSNGLQMGSNGGGWCKKSSVLILKNDDHDHHDESVTMWYRMNDYGNCK